MGTQPLTEAALLVAIFVILALGVAYLPIMSVLMLLVLSVPHAVLTWKRGLKVGLLAVVAAAIILFLFVDIVTAFMLVNLFALVGVAVGYLSKRYSAGKTLFISTLVGALSFGLVLFAVEIISGLDLIADMVSVYEQTFLAINESVGIVKLDIEAINTHLEMLATYLKPALILVFGFMVAFVNFKFFGIVGRRLELDVPRVPTLFEWRFPKWLGFGYVLGVALMYFAQEESMLNYLGMNISIILKWLLLFQGMALVMKFMRQYIKSRLFYMLLFIGILASPFIKQLVVILGLFDIFFDYQGWLEERGN